jgi:hypothetical protein
LKLCKQWNLKIKIKIQFIMLPLWFIKNNKWQFLVLSTHSVTPFTMFAPFIDNSSPNVSINWNNMPGSGSGKKH